MFYRFLILLYLSLDKTNKESVRAIQKSIFTVCLDAPMPRVSDELYKSRVAAQMLHGGGARWNSGNRWFDKTLQVSVRQIRSVMFPGDGRWQFEYIYKSPSVHCWWRWNMWIGVWTCSCWGSTHCVSHRLCSQIHVSFILILFIWAFSPFLNEDTLIRFPIFSQQAENWGGPCPNGSPLHASEIAF